MGLPGSVTYCPAMQVVNAVQESLSLAAWYCPVGHAAQILFVEVVPLVAMKVPAGQEAQAMQLLAFGAFVVVALKKPSAQALHVRLVVVDPGLSM